MKAYDLKEKGTKAFGDKVELHYEAIDSNNNMQEIKGLIKKYLQEKNLTAEGLIGENNKQAKIDGYENLRKNVGLTAGKVQKDVYVFIEKVLRQL